MNLKEKFTKLSLVYLDKLEFASPLIQSKVKSAWKENKDPANHFLGVFCEEVQNVPPLSLKKTKKKGYGVFTDTSLGKHRFIGEYTGVVKKRRFKMIFKNVYCVLYPAGFETFRTYVIDAEKKGNITRFINHSYDPNLEMKSTLFSDGLIHMVFITKRPIAKGEELTLDYGQRFWRQRLFLK